MRELQGPRAGLPYGEMGAVLVKRELIVCLECQSGDGEMAKATHKKPRPDNQD